MRCEKMHATISAETCKARRKDNGKRHSRGGMASQRTVSYLECKECPQGELVDQGLIVDLMDAHVLGFEQWRQSGVNEAVENQPEQVNVQSTREAGMKIVEESAVPGGSAAEEAGAAYKAVELRTCTRCRTPKPIGRFSRKSRLSEERIKICKDCKRDIDKDYRDRKQAGLKARKSPADGKAGGDSIFISGTVEEVGSGEVGASPAAGSEQGASLPTIGDIKDALTTLITSPEPLASLPTGDDSPSKLTIDLADYPEILETIKLLAHDFDRTPEAQVRWWLRCSFDAARECAEGEAVEQSRLVRFTVLDLDRSGTTPAGKEG